MLLTWRANPNISAATVVQSHSFQLIAFQGSMEEPVAAAEGLGVGVDSRAATDGERTRSSALEDDSSGVYLALVTAILGDDRLRTDEMVTAREREWQKPRGADLDLHPRPATGPSIRTMR
jgi:hypothetical protein